MRASNHRSKVRSAHPESRRWHAHRWLNASMMLLLMVSIFSNLTFTQTASAQQQDNTPAPFPAPSGVTVIGNFQAALGCTQDNDPTCSTTDLQLDDYGVWSGTFVIPPGSYTYRIVAKADQDRSLGDGADPNGDDFQLDVPDDSTGVFFSYNQRTGEIYASSISQTTELQTDFGTQPMFPEADANKFFAFIDGDPGAGFTAQVLVDGNPAGDPQQYTIGDGSRILIEASKAGKLDSKDIQPVVLNVTKTDADGNPLTGSCFSVYDGNNVAGQACDADDSEDGVTQIRFSRGVGNNGLKLAESLTPDGQETAPEQDIQLTPGVNDVAVVAGSGGGAVATDTATTETAVTVTFLMQDSDGNAITGGCLQFGDLGEQCDDDADGSIIFENVPANTSLDVTETQAPDGYDQFSGATVDVGDSDMDFPIQHAASGGGTGNLTLYTVDESNNPVPNVCYDITGVDGTQCDEDGDGDMGLTDLPAGDYTATQKSVPDGYQLDTNPQTITVNAGDNAQATFTSPTTQADTHTATIVIADENGNPVPGACFAVLDSSGNQVGDACDGNNAGSVDFALPDGDYTLQTSSVPDGYSSPDDQSFTVNGDDVTVNVTATSTAQPEETATEAQSGGSGAGTINASVTDADGFAIIGACISLDGPVSGETCDNGNGDGNSEDGQIQIQNLPDGDYTVSASQLPSGFDPALPVTVTIAGGNAVDAQLISGGGETAPTETVAAEVGSLLIRKYDKDHNDLAGACFTVTDAGGNAVAVCDNGDGDAETRDGRVRLDNLAPGDYTVSETTAPDGYTAAEDQTITVVAGDTARLNFIDLESVGSVNVVTTDGTNPVGGACYELSGSGQQCDDDSDGTTTFDSVPAGDYTVTQISVPDGYAASDTTDQPVTVAAGSASEVDFTTGAATGTITVSVVDEAGTAVTGACVAVDGAAPVCDDGSGAISLTGIAPGDHSVAMTTTPAGYVDGGSLDATVTAGEATTITFTLSVAAGRLDIVTANGDGDRIGGACYSISGGDPFCDNDANDGNTDDGVIRVRTLAPGDYTLTQTTAPDGYAAAADQTFTITAGERTRVDVKITPAYGSIEFTINDLGTQSPIAGACISSDGFSNEICDNGDGDADPADGVILVQNVQPGVYSVNISTVPDGYAVAEGGDNQVTVVAGETAKISRGIALQKGSVTISITNSDGGDPIVDGVCVTFPATADGTVICDGDGNDLNGDPGKIQIGNIEPGDYEVAVSSTTSPFVLPQATFPFTVAAGEDASVDIALDPIPPTETETNTPEPTSTDTETAVPTDTATETETAVPTDTATETETAVSTDTETAVPTDTATETIVPTDTNTSEPTFTETAAPTDTEAAIIIPPVDLTSTAEAGLPTETESATTAAATDTATSETTPEVTGSIRINVTDADGNALVGACFSITGPQSATVCDGDASDAEPADGIVEIDGLPSGDFTVAQSQAPDGYTSAQPQTASIAKAGDSAELTFVNSQTPVATGNLKITVTGTDNAKIGGACFQIGATEVCDNQVGDSDNTNGIVQFQGLPVGDYTVTETQAPNGYQAAADQTVTIAADETAELTFAHEAEPPQTGGVQFALKDADGQPAPESCIIVNGGNGAIDSETFCDGDKNDQSSDPAVLKLTDLPVGSYSVVQAPPEGQEEAFASAALDESSFTVQADTIIQVVVIIIITPPSVGDLQISKRAADTNQLQGGACFKVTGEGNEIEVCDNDDLDLNGAVGIIRLEDLSSGNYTISEITAPPGYQKAGNISTTIPNGGTRSVLVKDQPVADTTGGLIVHKIDGDGNFLKGSCFQLRDQGSPVATVCDADDGANDGKVTFKDIPAGDYLLRETKAPSSDYQLSQDTVVNIYGGVDDQIMEIVDLLKTGRIRLYKVDQSNNPLAGACFGLDRGNGIEFEACDNGAGDTSGTLGTIQFKDIPPANWTLVETLAPDGFLPAADQPLTLAPGQVANITVQDQPEPPSTDKGSVTVNKLVDGDLVGGACFALKQGALTRYTACDGSNNDGVIEFPSVAVGTYTLHETKAPDPTSWYQPGADKSISVTKNTTTEVDIVNKLKPGRILVIKKNTSGQVLQNACFTITPDPNSAGQRCTDATGQVAFENLPPSGSYKLTETKAPNGYQAGNPISGITLTPGLTSTVNVIDKTTPPPPTDGSVRIIKFFCPENSSSQTTTVLDSSDPGPDKLAQTQGCTKGDAKFEVQKKGDASTKYTFNTGADGEYFTTLPAGTWTLTEITPNKTSAQEFVITAGQQTTIVVIDYVKPPAPKPATVNIVKYTCDPGFGGVYYVDFLNNCRADSQLTNGVSFRTSGPTVQTRVTGSTGQIGKTAFTQLAAGNYTIYEDGVSGSETAYAFCGYDVLNWANWYSTNGQIYMPLKEGDVVTCLWFNVPDDLSDTTGAILVHKFVCNGTDLPSGYDYFANCPVQTTGAKFAISIKQGTTFVPKTTGISNVNGLLSFGQLKPGTYSLKEVGGDWCYAKSDNVDASGNLIVRAGERTNVWIFNCVKTTQPPNTGSGSMASSVSGGSDTHNQGPLGLIGMALPMLGFVGYRNRGKIRKAA